MTWGDSPEKIVRQAVRAWGDSVTKSPTSDPVEGWFDRLLKFAVDQGLSAEGALAATIVPRATIEALFTANATMTAGVDAGDGLRGTMWEGYLRDANLSALGSLSAAISARPNLYGQLSALGSLGGLMGLYSLNFPVAFAGAGSLGGTMGFPATAAVTTTYSAVGAFSYQIPWWATHIDVILLGGGGAGRDGGGGFISYEGGYAGGWYTTTLQRGVDISWATTTITGSVGAAGARSAGTGGNTTASATGWAGGTGSGGSGGSSVGTSAGRSPGNQTVDGQVYSGGAAQSSSGSAGNAPGGGGGYGAGGFISGSNAGNGAIGRAWLRAKQV